MKRFIALVLSLVMALSLCAPAWAAGDTMLGAGTETDPYIIETAEQLTTISNMYDGEYTYFKVADGVETLDLTGINKLKLNGSFDGNGVTLNNLTTALFQTVGKVGVAQEIKISNFTANVHTTDGRALVRNIYNPGTTIFENVTMHGYIEGQSNMGSFYNYGTANAGGSEGADYTVSFVNAKSDVTLVCTTGNVMGGMLGHGYEGANYQLSIEMDENSGYTGKMSTVGGKTCYQVMAMCSHATYMLNGVETSRYEKTYPSTALTVAAPEKTVDGYHVAPIDGVDHYVVFVNAQMSAYDDNGENIANLAGMTWPLGNKTISATNGKVFDLITDAKIVNSVEHDLGYAMDDGTLTIYSGRRENYASGWITLQVNQYDAENNLLATGNLEVYRFAEPEEFYTVSFDANGGSGEMNSLARTDAVKFTLPENGFTAPEGMKFKGWATSADGDVITDTLYAVTDNETLYAIWEEEECMGDSHVKVLVEYSGDVATKVYCDYCKVNFAFVQGTEDDAKDKFGEGNYVNAKKDVWYTLKAQSGEVPSVPEIPPVEDDKTEEDKPVVVPAPEEVDTAVKDNAMMEAVTESITDNEADNTVTVPAADSTTAKTTIEFNVTSGDNGAAAKEAFVNATPTDISTKVAVAGVSESVIESVEEKVEAEATKEVGAKAEIATYLDIDVQLFVNNIHVGNITELPETIEVVVPAEALPDDINDNIPTGCTRKFYVVRVHDGVTETIPAELDADGNLVFESHLFSTYAVVYEDVATSTNYPIYYWPVGDTTTTDEDVTSPKTFDAGVALYVGMSVAAAVGTVTLGKKRED